MKLLKQITKLVRKGQKFAEEGGELADEGTALVHTAVNTAEGAKGLVAACTRGLRQLRGEAPPQARKVTVEVVSVKTAK